MAFSSNPSGSRKERKAFIRELLQTRDLETLVRYVIKHKDSERILNSLLFDSENLIRWRAIETCGKVAAIKANMNIDSVRESIRRLLWAMNDESGNNIRHAPMLMGEILANVPELISEFAGYLPTFRDLSPYEQGVYWAMARVATVTPTAFEDFTDILLDSLSDPDPGIRGLALRALSPNARVSKVRPIQPLEKDTSELDYYDPAVGEFRRTTVGEIARRILAKCGSR